MADKLTKTAFSWVDLFANDEVEKMIDSQIINYGQYAHVGDPDDDENILDNCRNAFSFDCENLIVTASRNRDGGYEDVCSIFFQISPRLIRELKAFVNTMEVQCNDDAYQHAIRARL